MVMFIKSFTKKERKKKIRTNIKYRRKLLTLYILVRVGGLYV